MNFPRFFINRPIFAIVLSVLMLIAGAISYFQLPLSEYPQVTPPTVQVTASYPGANPQVIADTVASPLEQAVNGVEGMMYMQSQMSTDGRMVLTLSFEQHIDPDDDLGVLFHRHGERDGEGTGEEFAGRHGSSEGLDELLQIGSGSRPDVAPTQLPQGLERGFAAGGAASLGAGGGQVTSPFLMTVRPRMASSSMLTSMMPSLVLHSSSVRRNRLVA